MMLLTITKLLSFQRDEGILGIDFLVMIQHARATMEKNVKEVSRLLIESISQSICKRISVRKPFVNGLVDFLLYAVTFDSLLGTLPARYWWSLRRLSRSDTE